MEEVCVRILKYCECMRVLGLRCVMYFLAALVLVCVYVMVMSYA